MEPHVQPAERGPMKEESGRGTVQRIVASVRLNTRILIAVAILLVALLVYLKPGRVFEHARSTQFAGCTVAGIDVHGELFTYIPQDGSGVAEAGYEDATASDDVVSTIRNAEADKSVKGIMVEIDSPGGEPVAGEEIAQALRASTKPVVAYIRQTGASAAYWAATGASHIFASADSDVGSIGVTASYVQSTDPNQRYVELASGKYKDTGNTDKPLTSDDRALIQRDLDIIHENFIDAVAQNRGLPVDAVRAIADGSTVLGAKAKELGLIDAIGGYPDALAYLQEQIHDDPSICWQ